RRAPRGAAHVRVVARADGVGSESQGARLRGAPREEVHDLERAETPGAREADAAADRRVVAARVGRARIQHYERDARARRVPRAHERVAVAPGTIEDGGGGARREEVPDPFFRLSEIEIATVSPTARALRDARGSIASRAHADVRVVSAGRPQRARRAGRAPA